MKYSIIVPVYNVEKYIDKCLNSILNQTYENFEVIIVNDGTPDNSQKIIDKYAEKDMRFKAFIKKNGGLSDARNYGLKHVTGDYIFFIDSDDYIEPELLYRINDSLISNKNIDILKFKLKIVDENGKLIRKEKGYNFDGFIDFKKLIDLEFFEPAWSYVYERDFFERNNFKYDKGRVHEDFGLTPLVTIMANKIYYLNYYGYNYVQREGSIINSNDSSKISKKCNDTLYFYDEILKKINLIEYLDKNNIDLLKSFLANAVISRAAKLNGKELEKFCFELKKRKVVDSVLDDNLMRKIKKMVMKFNLKTYIKYFSR